MCISNGNHIPLHVVNDMGNFVAVFEIVDIDEFYFICGLNGNHERMH